MKRAKRTKPKATALHAVCWEHLARKLSCAFPLLALDAPVLGKLPYREVEVDGGTELVAQGVASRSAAVIAAGWAVRTRELPDGRRQIINFLVPGDIAGLSAGILHVADHSVVAITNMRIAVVSLENLARQLSDNARLFAALCWMVAQEESIVAEHLVDMGQRKSVERMAHLILELLVRLEAVGLAEDNSFVFPVSQELLGQALGISLSHVNRTLQRLRAAGLIQFRSRKIVVRDRTRLLAACKFDRTYLHLASSTRWVSERLAAGQERG